MTLTQLIIGACISIAPETRDVYQYCLNHYIKCTDKMAGMNYTPTNKLRLCVIADKKTPGGMKHQ